MSDNFTGRWLVSEYVYNPDGSFAGIVHQKRYVERITDTRLRVIQDCETSSELDNHPMREFRGHWEFDLEIAGTQRQYIGEDVFGTGFPYGETAMLGQGVWTRFGYNFTSFGILPSPHRQLTGGAFYNVNQMMSRIVGVAVPETEDALEQYPVLSQDIPAQTISDNWQGTLKSYDASGNFLDSLDIVFEYDDARLVLRDANAGETLQVTGDKTAKGIIKGTLYLDNKHQPFYGKSKDFGCSEDEMRYTAGGIQIISQNLVDADTSTLVIIQQLYRVKQLHQVNIAILKP